MERTLVIGLAAVLALAGSSAMGDVIVYQQGETNALLAGNYDGQEDSRLIARSDLADKNYGASTQGVRVHSSSYIDRVAVRWDLSSLAGQYLAINSVKLTLTSRGKTKGTGTVAAHAILPANSSWVEGTSFGAIETGASCWNYAQYDTAAWAGSGGCGSAGTDHDATALGSLGFTNGQSGEFEIVFDGLDAAGLKALIDAWSGAQAGNAGFLLKLADENTDDDRFEFYDDEDAGVNPTPKLTIDYTVIPEPASAMLVLLGGLALARRRRQ